MITSKGIYKRKYITGSYNGDPYITDTFILEFDTVVPVSVKAEKLQDSPTDEQIEAIIPKKIVEVEGVEVNDDEKVVMLHPEGVKVDQKYIDYITARHKGDVSFFVDKEEPYGKPVVVKSKGKMVALIMPLIK